jgi:hypothetical protein
MRESFKGNLPTFIHQKQIDDGTIERNSADKILQNLMNNPKIQMALQNPIVARSVQAALMQQQGFGVPISTFEGGPGAVNIPQRLARGGVVYANDGALVGFQSRGTDTIPAMLTPGEFVVNRRSAQNNLPLLQAINSGLYNKGGKVSYLARGGAIAERQANATLNYEKQMLERRKAYEENMLRKRQAAENEMERRRNAYASGTPIQQITQQFNRNSGQPISSNQLAFLSGGTPGTEELRRALSNINQVMLQGSQSLSTTLTALSNTINNFNTNFANINEINKPASNSGVSNTSNPAATLDALGNRLNQFIEQLQNALPPVIKVEGQHQVNVVINGASILQQLLSGPIGNIVQSAIQSAFDKQSRKREGY